MLTDGLCSATAQLLGSVFDENMLQSTWTEGHNSVMHHPLISITPWGIVADNQQLIGIHV